MQFVLVDHSTPPIDPAALAAMAAALEVQANRDISPEWGGNVRVRAATPTEVPVTGEVVALIVDTLPDVPGAIAYHSWTGTPAIFAARSLVATLSTGSDSLSVALSHEIAETLGDEGTNMWADAGDGSEMAHELSDPVESGFYDINGVAVSNFVLKAYFDPGAPPPYDFLATLGQGNAVSAPFAIANGGYAIKRSGAGAEHQVTAMFPVTVTANLTMTFGKRATKKSHWSSRTYRRGLRLTP